MKYFILTAILTLSLSAHATLQSCENDSYTASRINEHRSESSENSIEMKLTNSKGETVGALFSIKKTNSKNSELVISGDALYLCGSKDNYFYVNETNLDRWIPEIGSLKQLSVIDEDSPTMYSLIHNDEALMSSTAMTLDISNSVANIKIMYMYYDMADDLTESGEFFVNIPTTLGN